MISPPRFSSKSEATKTLLRFFGVGVLFLSGCRGSEQKSPPPVVGNTPAPAVSPIQFTDVTAQSGIKFKHNSGAFGLKLMPETMGSGVAFFDYDSDGDADLFFVNCRYWTEAEAKEYQKGKWSEDEMTIFKRHHPPGTKPVRKIPARIPQEHTTGALYQNNGDGTFRDVTSGSGLDVEMFGMGTAAGDFNNDGRVDLYVTALGRNYLFENSGNGRFREVAEAKGVRDSGWSTSAAWLDYDKDGRLDLFVCHYVKWTPANDRYGTMNGKDKSYTAPFFYASELSRLYHNEGSGKFEDVSAKSGIQSVSTSPSSKAKTQPGKSLGVAICDYNNDGWPDIAVANDGEPNWLFRNNKNGKFSEVAALANFARDVTGNTRAGMGIDTADIDHSNRDSIVIGNFDDEMIGLYYNRGNGLFDDIAPATEVGQVSRTFSVFGCAFIDVDNDTWADILTASGHIDEQITGIRGTSYALRPLLFRNEGKGKYREIGLQSGSALQHPIVARGLACADIDLDGDLDVALTTNAGPPLLLRNDGGNKHNSIRLILQGSQSNRSGLGALVKVKLGNDVQRHMVRSGSSYLSQSELPLTIGLGNHKTIDGVAVRWPSGKMAVFDQIAANQILTINEKQGIVRQQPFPRR